MHRSTRIVVATAALVLLVGVGTALANRADRLPRPGSGAASTHEPDASHAPDAVSRAVERLEASEIDADAALLEELAAAYGVGGAVRLAAWSDASGMSVDDLRAMRDDGMGWGQIAHELDLHPGIGSIMGQGGTPPAGIDAGPPVRTPDD